MNIRSRLSTLGIFLVCAVAAVAAPSATVVAIKGSVQTADHQALQPGATLPIGAVVRTSGGSEVSLRFFDGTVASVLADSELIVERIESQQQGGRNVTETTVLNLQRGTVVASLDPAKKDVTRFSVRTPRGVAVAKGTVFAVRVTQDKANATVGTMSGVVTFLTDRGEISVAFGQVTSGGSAQSVAAAVAADPSLAAVFSEAALSIAAAVGQGAITNTADTPNLVAAVLAAVVKVAAEANPSQAGNLAQAVTAAAGIQDPAVVAIVNQAASSGTPAARNAPAPGTADTGAILPALDQTQVVVSPSRN
ncbi:MAG: FecR domain-containing protein [Candidatus Didemnitutus sp.]|nr:FecR domain-containing protein [Candidatus Didemnitutus sp.]